MIAIVALVAIVALLASFIGGLLGAGMVLAIHEKTDAAVDDAMADPTEDLGPLDDQAAIERAHALWIGTRL